MKQNHPTPPTEFQKRFEQDHPAHGDLFVQAFALATAAHAGQQRLNGQEFIIHPIAVAARLEGLYHDPELTIAALLHDTVEDSEDISFDDIYDTFGPQIGFLVEGMTKTDLIYSRTQDSFSDYYSKLFWFGMTDVRVLLLKLADREHNLATSAPMSPSRRARMCLETVIMYVPLAQFLGSQSLTSIEDMSQHFMRALLTHQLLTPSHLQEFFCEQWMEEEEDLLFEIITPADDLAAEEVILQMLDTVKHSESVLLVQHILHYASTLLNAEQFFPSTQGRLLPME